MRSMRVSPQALERISVTVPESALEAYEAAFSSVCESVGWFRDHAARTWQIEGVRRVGANETALRTALMVAAAASGVSAEPLREPIPAEGWLAASYASFPEQLIGRRFVIRGSHIKTPRVTGRITLALDAGAAFGSGEHGSTRGCLRALERVASRRPRRILDLGTGSGVLAMAAARLLHRPVLATDIEPWSVRLARQNARTNGLGALVRPLLADGWRHRAVRANGPYDLVLANILARPLARMAKDLAKHLAAGGTVILSGILATEARAVLSAHRRHGLSLTLRLDEAEWTTLVLRAAPLRPHVQPV
jgi:ribosomal protein L11 methyltransferase